MTSTLLIEIAIIPAALIVGLGMLVLRSGSPQTAGRRLLIFLFGATLVLSAVVFLTGRLLTGGEGAVAMQIGYLLTPSVLGLLILIGFNIRAFAGLSWPGKVLSLLVVAAVILAALSQAGGMGLLLVATIAGAGLAWLTLANAGRPALALGVAVLTLFAAINLPNGPGLNVPYGFLPSWLGLPAAILLACVPGLAVTTAAVLVTSGLRLLPGHSGQAAGPLATPRPGSAIARFALAGLLLAYLVYTVLWMSIWDKASDGMSGLIFAIPTGIAGIAGGMVMALLLRDRRAAAGAVFAVAVPLLMLGAFTWGWAISYQGMTDTRAQRIQSAVEGFQARNGRYPAQLAELVPGYLFWVPRPVILRGQDWCYQGGPDYYRLGAFYRGAFGAPVSLRIYGSAGTPPDAGWNCGPKLAEMKARLDPMPFEARVANPAGPPLPASTVSIPKTLVQPALTAGGPVETVTWSPDGRYLLFGQPESLAGERVVSLGFLEAASGRICPAGLQRIGQEGIREHAAWLPDGRLLFVPGGADMSAVTPCEPGAQALSGRYPVSFEQAAAGTADGSRILLKATEGYWILDGRTLETRQIPDVAPNPDEYHTDRYAWLPDGSRVAISRLNGRDGAGGSTVYVIDGATGQPLLNLPSQPALEQSAALVHWLTRDLLLTQGPGDATVVHLDATPPRQVLALEEFFGVDYKMPDEIWALGWSSDPGGATYHAAVRFNRADNQTTGIYHSHQGRAVFGPYDAPVLMFFPGGDWAEMSKVDPKAPERDEYTLIWVDQPADVAPKVAVEGHLPRNYARLGVTPVPGEPAAPGPSRLAFSSSRGVSLVSVPDGKLLRFWDLEADQRTPYVLAAPHGEALVAVAGGTLFYLSLAGI